MIDGYFGLFFRLTIFKACLLFGLQFLRLIFLVYLFQAFHFIISMGLGMIQCFGQLPGIAPARGTATSGRTYEVVRWRWGGAGEIWKLAAGRSMIFLVYYFLGLQFPRLVHFLAYNFQGLFIFGLFIFSPTIFFLTFLAYLFSGIGYLDAPRFHHIRTNLPVLPWRPLGSLCFSNAFCRFSETVPFPRNGFCNGGFPAAIPSFPC